MDQKQSHNRVITKANKNDSNDNRQKYEPSEHKDIGNQALQKLFAKYPILTQQIVNYIDPATAIIVQDNVIMTAGEWIALAGDFYGIINRPISGLPTETIDFNESMERFKEAYNSLAIVNENSKHQLNCLLTEIREEERVVAIAKQKGVSVSHALHERSTKSNTKYAEVTSNNILAKILVSQLPLAVTGLTIETRYLELSENNFDHFGIDARTAYRAGHRVALDSAAIAKSYFDEKDMDNWKKFFTKAITQELFACHYLTDLFSSGHMRVPRKQIVNAAKNYKIAGLLSLIMHNEDGETGLWVTSGKHKEPWLAKGDGCLHETDAKENKALVIEAVSDALISIYEASVFEYNMRAKFNFEDYVPTPLTGEQPKRNVSPLFLHSNNTVKCRADIYSSKCNEHTSNWYPIPTLARLWLFKETSSQQIDEHKANDLENEIKVKSEPEAVESSRKTCVLL